MSIPDEGYSRNASCTLNSISMFYYYGCPPSGIGDRTRIWLSYLGLGLLPPQNFFFQSLYYERTR